MIGQACRVRTSRHSEYLSTASCSFPALKAVLPSSFNLSMSFIRLLSFMAGSWPGSKRRADVRCCSAWGNRPPRKRTRPRSVSASGELGFNRRVSLVKRRLNEFGSFVIFFLGAYFAEILAASQLPFDNSSSILQYLHSGGTSPPSPSIACKHLSNANLASPQCFFCLACSNVLT